MGNFMKAKKQALCLIFMGIVNFCYAQEDDLTAKQKTLLMMAVIP